MVGRWHLDPGAGAAGAWRARTSDQRVIFPLSSDRECRDRSQSRSSQSLAASRRCPVQAQPGRSTVRWRQTMDRTKRPQRWLVRSIASPKKVVEGDVAGRGV